MLKITLDSDNFYDVVSLLQHLNLGGGVADFGTATFCGDNLVRRGDTLELTLWNKDNPEYTVK